VAHVTNAISTRQLVARYAAGFNARYAVHHGVTSPLGAWLLLAVAAPATDGDARARLEAVLGCPAADAAERAAALLSTAHPAVSCAAAVWWRPDLMVERFGAIVDGLPAGVERGPVPSRAAADRWAAEHTGGLIERFPIEIDVLSALVLATAVATDVSWAAPFTEVPGTELGGAWGAAATSALAAVHEHQQFVAATDHAGLVAVHIASARRGLDVVSVLAAADTAPTDVHAAAHEVAAMLAGDASGASRVSLFDLPLGDGAAWTLTERVETRYSGGSKIETVTSFLPAWSANSTHDVLAAPGFGELCDTFGALLRAEEGPPSFDAVQSAVARYTRVGFAAAAITAFGMRAGAMPHEVRAVCRYATVRFNRPYAVVAVATDRLVDETGRPTRADTPAWSGMPVFSAWVERPDPSAEPGPAG